MKSLFSVDDLLDPFWQASSVMNRSTSEWELEKFLEEVSGEDDVAVVEIKRPQIRPHPSTAAMDPNEYHAFLKSKLDLACAAVAVSRETESNLKPEGLCTSAEGASDMQALGSSGLSRAQGEADGGSLSIPALPSTNRKQDGQLRQATSGSSREDSDDDELEGDTETTENTDPADVKRARRMQSNRESARRSRRRKQAQLSELETQVVQLRDERSSLLSRFTDMNKKCDDAAVDNRILKANIETLRAKVKMAEDQVKQVTGLNPMLLARSNPPNMGMQFVGGQGDAPTNFALPMQPNANQFFNQSVPNIASAAPHMQRLNNTFPNKSLVPPPTNLQMDNGTTNISGMTSMQLTASGQSMTDIPSMQHAEKQVAPTVAPGSALPECNPGPPHLCEE